MVRAPMRMLRGGRGGRWVLAQVHMMFGRMGTELCVPLACLNIRAVVFVGQAHKLKNVSISDKCTLIIFKIVKDKESDERRAQRGARIERAEKYHRPAGRQTGRYQPRRGAACILISK